MIFYNHNNIKKQSMVATNIIFPVCYLIFAKVILIITNKCPFPPKLILVGNPWWVIICYIIGICLGFLLLGYGLHFANRFINKKLKR